MKNTFTTREQSVRLLELGLPIDTADCYRYIPTQKVSTLRSERDGFTYSYSEYMANCIVEWGEQYYEPCWSLGCLIEILFAQLSDFDKCDDIKISSKTVNDGLVEFIIQYFERKIHKMNFK